MWYCASSEVCGGVRVVWARSDKRVYWMVALRWSVAMVTGVWPEKRR